MTWREALRTPLPGERLLTAVALLAVLLYAVHAAIVKPPAHQVNRHWCLAPCSVRFTPGTEEDAWAFDYGWATKTTSVVDVFRGRMPR